MQIEGPPFSQWIVKIYQRPKVYVKLIWNKFLSSKFGNKFRKHNGVKTRKTIGDTNDKDQNMVGS